MRIGVVGAHGPELEAILHTLALAPRHTVAWLAHDADAACSNCTRERPDLVLMDLFVPGVGGAEATRRIMAGSPCAVLLIAADVGTYATQIFEAMGNGALDAVDIPLADGANYRASASAFLRKLDDVDRRLRELNTFTARPNVERAPAAPAATLIAIGASAGGPAALRTVLGGLASDLKAAVIIVQHLDQRFAAGMVDWLSAHSTLPLRMMREGDSPTPGQVLLAGTDNHLVLRGPHRLGYTPQPLDYVYRPSVDVFFNSVHKWWGGEAIGLLLTGMGRDGALGLKQLRDKGYHTIAQDQASSAVYGMPKAAVELGAAVESLALGAIADRLNELVAKDKGGK